MWPEANNPTNPDATPVLDGWGWADYWPIEDWMTWHASMKARYGIEHANRTFLQWWHSQGVIANPYNARSFNSSFRDYARANGFFDGLFGENVFVQPLGAAGDVVSGVSSAVSTTGSVLKWVLPVAAIAVLAIYAAPYVVPAFKRARAAVKA